MSYLLGIDVGTTRTAAAICRPEARGGEIVPLSERSSAAPSVLYVGGDGSLLVGDAAERRAVSEPDRVVREFKRRIGDPTPLLVGGRPWTPEELSARLVRWVVDRVTQREGGPPARIAVTHPASWGPHKKDRLGAALAAQGLPVSFLAEPQAAALHYASTERVEPGSTIAVYDLGGGTFDAAVVHKDPKGFSLLGRPEGLERLGGIDFDDVVFEHVRQGLPGAFDGLDDTDPAALSAVAAVRRDCAEAKEALSSDTEVSIPVLTPGAQGSVRLHRSEFEAMIRPQIEQTVEALRRAIGSAGLTPAQLDAVLLVGGSSRIPLVAQLVSELLARPVAVDADPKHAIALGAALSLTPAGVAATGGAARVPTPRSPAGRQAQDSGPTELVRNPTGTAGHDYPARPPRPAAPPVGPPTQRRTGTGSMSSRAAAPPGRPKGYPDRPDVTPDDVDFDRRGDDGYDYDYEDQPARRPAVLVSIGGAFAAVAVIGIAFLFPATDPVTSDAGRFSVTPAGGPAAITTTSEEPEPTKDDGEDDDAERTTRPVPTIVVPTTEAPATTAPPAQTTTPAPQTTTKSQPPQPPPDDDDDDPPPPPTSAVVTPAPTQSATPAVPAP